VFLLEEKTYQVGRHTIDENELRALKRLVAIKDFFVRIKNFFHEEVSVGSNGSTYWIELEQFNHSEFMGDLLWEEKSRLETELRNGEGPVRLEGEMYWGFVHLILPSWARIQLADKLSQLKPPDDYVFDEVEE
jgi:hypothetical protein